MFVSILSVPVFIFPVILTNGRATEALDLDVGVASVTHPTRVSTRTVRNPSDAFIIDDARHIWEDAHWVGERILLNFDMDSQDYSLLRNIM
ncbi:hypothetical protein CVT25_011525 [Psilocybe cyanescens]|uniref:Uncharacterized protein n=1 Tax=Psilocybe cyanescens TaxID=93625 RepID=A0A409XV16_PSICY|nr:hypothetical protein CVT25_011525 [Psilocybe cyanescens]